MEHCKGCKFFEAGIVQSTVARPDGAQCVIHAAFDSEKELRESHFIVPSGRVRISNGGWGAEITH